MNIRRGDFFTKVTKQQLWALRDSSGMVFQHYDHFQNKTALENVMEGSVQVQNRSKDEAVREARELFGPRRACGQGKPRSLSSSPAASRSVWA